MVYLPLLREITLVLNEPGLLLLLRALHQSVQFDHHQAIFLGKVDRLCEQLEQLWKQALERVGTREVVENPLFRIILPRSSSRDYKNASLLLLSPHFQVWVQLQPISHPTTQAANAQPYPDLLEEVNQEWQISLNFKQQAIAKLLKVPEIATVVADQIPFNNLQASNTAIQQFWFTFNRLVQHTVDSSFSPVSPLNTAPSDFWLQQAPIGILQLGLDGSILTANPAFCELTGYSEVQLRHLDNRGISHPEDFVTEARLLQQMVAQGSGQQTLHKRYRCWDGSIAYTEVKLSLIGDVEAETGMILCFVTDLSDRQRIEQEIEQRRKREALLNEISAQIRTTFDFQAILKDAIQRLRDALIVDRVVVYQLFPDQSGLCLVENVDPAYPAMVGRTFSADCIPTVYLEAFQQGCLSLITNIHTAGLSPCHQAMLEAMGIRSMMAAAIVSNQDDPKLEQRRLWGLIFVHDCRGPRQWIVEEQDLLQAVAHQLVTALGQTKLLQQLQHQNQELELRVQQRTQALKRSLKFEQFTRSLMESLWQNFDNQLHQTAVKGLAALLEADVCFALHDRESDLLEISNEAFAADSTQGSLIGLHFSLDDLSPICQKTLLTGQTYVYQSCEAVDGTEPDKSRFFNRVALLTPIKGDRELAGVLIVLQNPNQEFEAFEVDWVEQTANYCAIALRQTHLYQQEYEQRFSADYFRAFLEKSGDVFVEYDAELRYVTINAAGCELLGQPIERIIGKTNRELLGVAAESIEPSLQQAFETGEKVILNHEINFPQSSRVFETVYTPIVNPLGTVQRVIGVCRDISDLKQQWQLLEVQNHELAETTRLKEEFVATTSHELRTPLTAILGFSNVLLQEFFGPLTVKQKEYLERIHNSGQHLLDLINDILDLSRLEADRLELELQATFVPEICESVIYLIQERAQEQGLLLSSEIEPSVDWMVADPRRLKQMLLNLLTNAIKFTQAGTVGLKVYRRPQDAAMTPYKSSPFEVIDFEIWDTGIGIAESDQKLLFSPFSQIDSSLSRKHQGTGLGLVITRKLAELHGGTVTLESNPNQGSRFTLSLPLNKID